MTAIPRLLQTSKNPATRELLQAGLRDHAPERSILFLTVALGLEAIASAAPAQSAFDAATNASAPAAGGAALPVASKSLPLALSIGKWLLLGMCAGGASTAVYWSQTPSAPERQRSAAQVTARAVRAPIRASGAASPSRVTLAEQTEPAASATAEPIPSAGGQARTSSASPAGRAAERDVPPRSAAQEQSVTAEPADTRIDGALERETRLIDGARQALAARDSSRASALLDSYDATKEIGVLDREALLLRVELLLARGDQPGARALAERFTQRYPTDAHRVRLRALLSAPAQSGGSPK